MNIENTREYYGRTLTRSEDLVTDACCSAAPGDRAVRAALAEIHPEVRARYYGCGLVVPPAIEGARVLDLGSGSGQDAYVLARLVGPMGLVTGVDATSEQLAVARAHLGWHAKRFGHANVEFLEGDIEQLDALGLAPASFDLVVSNCVINLVADKLAVFRAVRSLLRPGGELYFADIYADRRLPVALRADKVLHGECLAGALYRGDFLELARQAGFIDPRLVEQRALTIGDGEVAAKLAGIGFTSATYRLFALDGLEPGQEDYALTATYRGTVPGSAEAFALDAGHVFETGRAVPVSSNTWRMLAETRLAAHFDLSGDLAWHRGAFGAGAAELVAAGGGCC